MVDHFLIVPNDKVQSPNSDNGISASCEALNAITPFPICFNFEQVYLGLDLFLLEFELNTSKISFLVYDEIKFVMGS